MNLIKKLNLKTSELYKGQARTLRENVKKTTKRIDIGGIEVAREQIAKEVLENRIRGQKTYLETKHQRDTREELNKLTNRELVELLPSDKDVLALRILSSIQYSDRLGFEKECQRFDISQDILEELENRGYIAQPPKYSLDFLKRLPKTEIGSVEMRRIALECDLNDTHLKDLRNRGYIRYISEQEQKFLLDLDSSKKDVYKLSESYGICSDDFLYLKRNSFCDKKVHFNNNNEYSKEGLKKSFLEGDLKKNPAYDRSLDPMVNGALTLKKTEIDLSCGIKTQVKIFYNENEDFSHQIRGEKFCNSTKIFSKSHFEKIDNSVPHSAVYDVKNSDKGLLLSIPNQYLSKASLLQKEESINTLKMIDPADFCHFLCGKYESIGHESIELMKKVGIIEVLDEKTVELISSIPKNQKDSFKLGNVRNLGFIENDFRENLNGLRRDFLYRNVTKEEVLSNLIENSHMGNQINSKKLESLLRRNRLDVLSNMEAEALRNNNLESIQSETRRYQLSKRIQYKYQLSDLAISSNKKISSLKEIGLLKDRRFTESELLMLAKENGLNLSSKELNMALSLSSIISKEIDYKVLDKADIFSTPKKSLNEKPSQVVSRIYFNRELISSICSNVNVQNVPLARQDVTNYLNALLRDFVKMSQKEARSVMLFNLNQGNIENLKKVIATNIELNFIDSKNYRTMKKEDLYKYALEECDISEDRLNELIEQKYLKLTDTESGVKIFSMTHEGSLMTDLRSGKDLSSFNDVKTANDLRSVIDNGSGFENFIIKTEAVPLLFKMHKGEELSLSESNLAIYYTRNGFYKGSGRLNEFVRNIPVSSRLKILHKNLRTLDFIDSHEVKIDALKFVNTFKQVTKDQLNKIGVSDQEIENWVGGMEYEGHNIKLLRAHRLPTPRGLIIYYSIQHSGYVSGRTVLEKDLQKSEIASSPQGRQDLLFHDLKVVDCVLDAKERLESKGYKIVSVKNESSQFSKERQGIVNNERNELPHFMDAVLEVEGPNHVPGSKPEVIAVEYGNYTNDRMKSKLENSNFDSALVYSNATTMNKYIKSIEVSENVQFFSI